LAHLLAQLGEQQPALELLSDGLRRAPDNPDLLACRARISINMKDYDRAERDLHAALKLNDAHAETHLELGTLLSKKALWRQALPHLRRSIELGADQARAHVLLGEALNCTDDLNGALKAYERALELQPNDPATLRGLGIIYDRLGRASDAVQMYHRSRAVDRSTT
jgi:tetratricopeptide (TPR) repeat protein